MFGDDEDDRFGLPLLRARVCLVGEALWKPALKAFAARANLAWPDEVPGSPWRYEVFVPQARVPKERLGSWNSYDSRQARPFYRAEVERQDTFYKTSIELGRRLLRAGLRGYGQMGTIGGPWTAIPQETWRILRVPFAADFQNWGLGHVVAGNSAFWGVRIIDTEGLSLAAAALAYGLGQAAYVVQRAAALGIRKEPVHERGSPNSSGASASRMVSFPDPLAPDPLPSAEEVEDAWRRLRVALFEALLADRLIARGLRRDGTASVIPTSFWSSIGPDFDLNTGVLASGGLSFGNIRITQKSSDAARDGQVEESKSRFGIDLPKRRSGGVNYEEADRPLIDEMRRTVLSGSESVPMNAARAVAERAAGRGTPDSKVKRLVGAYNRRFGQSGQS